MFSLLIIVENYNKLKYLWAWVILENWCSMFDKHIWYAFKTEFATFWRVNVEFKWEH